MQVIRLYLILDQTHNSCPTNSIHVVFSKNKLYRIIGSKTIKTLS